MGGRDHPVLPRTFPFDALHVQQHRLRNGHVVANILQDGHQRVQVVRVYGSHVVEAELFEEGPSRGESTHILVDAFVDVLSQRVEATTRWEVSRRKPSYECCVV